ncbi:MAG: HNH endonuclease [Alphaproteobacteria bacterium]|nr:HNH endonuclease [Alphaproteobacteria bacterium]
MRLFVANTDNAWFDFLARHAPLDEVNFWRPGAPQAFRALQPGDVFVFRLKRPRNAIGGAGIFLRDEALPVSLAWDCFGPANGVPSLTAFRESLARLARTRLGPADDPVRSARILGQPVFLPPELWIDLPEDWSPTIVSGKTYDASTPIGRDLWDRLSTALGAAAGTPVAAAAAALPRGWLADGERYGVPAMFRPRLGQGTFRLAVTGAYERRCAVSGERVLPALEAAHIRPYAEGGEHAVPNGLLLRRDIHGLYDRGYVTVDPDGRFLVSRQVREEFRNGREYYALHGQLIRPPQRDADRPSRAALEWHTETVFRG